jgi:type II secretory pathway component GspD/PulD (secretin)
MKKSKYRKIIFVGVILCVALLHGPAQVQPALAGQGEELEIGRKDPFAAIPRSMSVGQDDLYPAEAPELFVETVVLKFLDATNLKLAIEKMSSPYGGMAVNAKNNSLMICDTKEHLAKIVSEVRKADKRPQQIMVEVVIVDVQLDDDTEIGVNWDILSDKNYDIGFRQNFTESRVGSTIESATNIGNATAFNTTGLGGAFSVISGTIRNVVHLLQQERHVEILASPRVMMMSGQSALVQAVDEIPYEEESRSSQGGTVLTYTEFKEVGVTLNVSATLTDNNDILLKVDAEQNVQVGTTSPPRVDTRKASSSLLLADSQVVVFGGLRRQEKTIEVDQIPILGDIPLLGFLFKSTNTIVKNSELIVFLSPHIYKGEPVPDDAMAKHDEITQRPMLSLPADGEVPGAEQDRAE